MLPPNWTTDTQPIMGISWDDANAYAAWLSDVSGNIYTLPTEEQWEYAARAGQSTKYYWGDEDTSGVKKRFWKNKSLQNAHDYTWMKTNVNGVTHTIGGKKPNAWGLYDMAGNVWEWTSSYSENYNLLPQEENLKVMRGGSWFSTSQEISLSHRGTNVNDFTSYNIGFRLIRQK